MLIAHLSDLHLGIVHHRENSRRARRVLDHLTDLNPDHVVVTGDLSWDAHREELLAARSLFEESGFYSSGRLTVIPGNHDVFGGVRTTDEMLNFYSRCKWTPFEERMETFQQVFRELFEGCHFASRKRMFPFVKVVNGVALIGINSIMRHHPVKNPFGSNGQVGKKEKARLKLLLSMPRLIGTRKVALIHHHFHRPAWKASSALSGLWLAFENRTMKLRKKPPLLRLFRRFGIELVLHGHHHESCEYELGGIRFLNAGGTLMGPDAPALSINLIRVEGERTGTGIHRIPFDQRLSMAPPVPAEDAVHIAA